MLDHVSLGVGDLSQSTTFYDAVMATLGAVRLWRSEKGAGYGPPGDEDKLAIFAVPGAYAAGSGSHLAFGCATTEIVDQFYRAAMAQGATDEGAPGFRERYGPGYYAAFVRDLDGNKLEAVCHVEQKK